MCPKREIVSFIFFFSLHFLLAKCVMVNGTERTSLTMKYNMHGREITVDLGFLDNFMELLYYVTLEFFSEK